MDNGALSEFLVTVDVPSPRLIGLSPVAHLVYPLGRPPEGAKLPIGLEYQPDDFGLFGILGLPCLRGLCRSQLPARRFIKETILELVTKRLKESYNADPLRDVQIISPLRERTALSCKALNAECQARLNKNPQLEKCPFKVGDKVIQTKNEYEKDIINGDIGYIRSINLKEKAIYVDFENPDRLVEIPLYENNLELAYTVTVHKYQGSEAPIVIIPIHQNFGPFLMQRNLLYTAISRAKKVCILVGQRDEIPKIIKRDH